MGACGIRAEEFGDAVAGVFEPAACPAAVFVLARWIEIRFGPAGAHRFDHFWQRGCGGVVVEVDRGGHRFIISVGEDDENQREIANESGIGGDSGGGYYLGPRVIARVRLPARSRSAAPSLRSAAQPRWLGKATKLTPT